MECKYGCTDQSSLLYQLWSRCILLYIFQILDKGKDLMKASPSIRDGMWTLCCILLSCSQLTAIVALPIIQLQTLCLVDWYELRRVKPVCTSYCDQLLWCIIVWCQSVCMHSIINIEMCALVVGFLCSVVHKIICKTM